MVDLDSSIAADAVGIQALIARLRDPVAVHRFRSADPFPHLVLDDVLDAPTFAAAAAEFPALADPSWNAYRHVNETKYANPDPGSWGPTLRAVAEALVSDELVDAVAALTGFDRLTADWTMDGGGLHQTLRGGHLNVHTDFRTHHVERTWTRRVNVLLYLNETWSADWGGALQLWDADVTRCVREVAPVGNRMLVFATSDRSFHGHPDALQCPDDVARRSLALYYFTVGATPPPARSTTYRARPGDGLHRLSIALDSRALALYDAAKRRFGLSDGPLHRITRRLDRRARR